MIIKPKAAQEQYHWRSTLHNQEIMHMDISCIRDPSIALSKQGQFVSSSRQETDMQVLNNVTNHYEGDSKQEDLACLLL